MSASTARKITLAFLAIAMVLTFASPGTAQQRYRKLWGATVLAAGAAVLADFAPAVVGPFVALVLVAYLAGHGKQVGAVTGAIKSQATGKA